MIRDLEEGVQLYWKDWKQLFENHQYSVERVSDIPKPSERPTADFVRYVRNVNLGFQRFVQINFETHLLYRPFSQDHALLIDQHGDELNVRIGPGPGKNRTRKDTSVLYDGAELIRPRVILEPANGFLLLDYNKLT